MQRRARAVGVTKGSVAGACSGHDLMRLLIRCDGGAQIGGGHVMRCLTLAEAMRKDGGEAAFVLAEDRGGLADLVRQARFRVTEIPPAPRPPDPSAPPHGDWLSAPWQADAEVTARAALSTTADWLVWDHYGLDSRWVAQIRSACPGLRVMAIDDLGDRPLGSDLLLDQTRLAAAPRSGPVWGRMTGPAFALLRSGFADARPAALARRGGPVARVLILPGLADAAGLAPLALRALDPFVGLAVDIAMGSASQSRTETAALVADRPVATLHLDPPDMAALMARADLCIGAGGMSAWERCALGLPSVAVCVADNQRDALAGLAAAGAAITLGLTEARQPGRLAAAIGSAIAGAPAMSRAAARLCDGRGTARVITGLSGKLRPVTAADKALLFGWRNQPAIRAASITQDPLDPDAHAAWLGRTLARTDGLWCIYSEADRPLGHINATHDSQDTWHWSFYIGATDAPRGAGSRMMAAFLHHILQRPDFGRMTAEVRRDNLASIHLHQSFGFETAPAPGPDLLAFTWSRCDQGSAFSYPPIGTAP